jgi:hypothetical protein
MAIIAFPGQPGSGWFAFAKRIYPAKSRNRDSLSRNECSGMYRFAEAGVKLWKQVKLPKTRPGKVFWERSENVDVRLQKRKQCR